MKDAGNTRNTGNNVSEAVEILPNKRIIVTAKTFSQPYIKVRTRETERNYFIALVSTPSIAGELVPRNGNAYLLEPDNQMDLDGSWLYGGFLTKVCDSFYNHQVDSVALVRPGFLESLVGYHEIDKLRQFIAYDE